MKIVGVVSAFLVVALVGLAPGASSHGATAGSRSARGRTRSRSASVIVYSSDWGGPTELLAVSPSTTRTLGQLTFGTAPACSDVGGLQQLIPCGFADALPAPNGRRFLYRGIHPQVGQGYFDPTKPGSLWLATATGSGARELPSSACDGSAEAWSPDSKAIACFGESGLHVLQLRRGGFVDRLVFRGFAGAGGIVWSTRGIFFCDGLAKLLLYRNGRTKVQARCPGSGPVAGSADGRLLAFVVYPSREFSDVPPHVVVTDRHGSVQLTLGKKLLLSSNIDALPNLAWSPNGRWLAFQATKGIGLADLRSHRQRLLTHDSALDFAWSPDSRTLAYVSGNFGVPLPHVHDLQAQTGDLRTVTLSGRARTIVSADRSDGGQILSVAWAHRPAGVSYRRPEPAPPGRLAGDALLAPGPIEALAADGDRVAYASCEHIYLWTPSTGSLASVPTVGPPGGYNATPPAISANDTSCWYPYEYSTGFTGLALAGGRAVWGMLYPSAMSSNCWVDAASIAPPNEPVPLDDGCAAFPEDWLAVGDVVGGGSFLGFSEWEENCVPRYSCGSVVTAQQTIERVDGTACPCTAIASSPGPLIAFDADDNRLVVGGNNATLILDTQGRQLLSVPVAAAAAQLSGNDLVVVVRGELRDYNASTGQLEHRWPLPDVSSGEAFVGPLRSSWPSLTLEDAARSLAAYIVGNGESIVQGQLHVIRLADGKDTLIGPASLARFTDTGLAYAEGARIRLIPFAQLPLR